MGKVVVKKEQDSAWEPIQGMPEVDRRFVFDGKEGMPEVFLIRRDASFVGPVHSHSQNEIIYILEGDVTVGEEHCPTGTVLYVEKDTMYGPLRSGPDGVTFLNIRPTMAGTSTQGR